MTAWIKALQTQWQKLQKRYSSSTKMPIPKKETGSPYFKRAQSWADDYYTSAITSRNRWRAMTLYVCLPIMVILFVWVSWLIPSQRLVPVEVDHYPGGYVVVKSPEKTRLTPKNSAEVKSQIARYIRNRESYSPQTYHAQYSLVALMSNAAVAQRYIAAQSTHNRTSPINTLGHHAYRTVRINRIWFLDKVGLDAKERGRQNHHNVARVEFTVTQHDTNSDQKTQSSFEVIVSWTYRTLPKDTEALWRDWDGFTVTHYSQPQQVIP